ncbi:MAG: (d)CMP kinase, partial [Bacilli bacterium]
KNDWSWRAEIMKDISIAIDGPAGAGKSTVARKVAEQLNFVYIDTGAMYRAVTWKSIDEGITMNDDEKIVSIANSIKIEFHRSKNGQLVYVNGVDITEGIRSTDVTNQVSYVSSLGGVREKLVELQQKMADAGGVVMDGRDIGTIVLPHAELKIFLTASIEERARRRYEEMKNKGYMGSIEDVKLEMMLRDDKDSRREISPLRQAEDALLLDTTGLTIDGVVGKIVNLGRTKMNGGE